MTGESWAYRVPGCTLDALSDALDIAGIAVEGLSEEKGTATAWCTTRPEAPMPLAGRWERVDDADWAERWKEGLEPRTVGRITVLPPWLASDDPPSGDQIVLAIEPGMAFGTGHHETTLGCLSALQELDLAGCRVIDVGTGTGVLALAAATLGAVEVVAVDTDPVAVMVAGENVAAHAVDTIVLRTGSSSVAGPPADVVVANLITDTLLALASDLVGLAKPGGTLICSGVSVERTHEVLASFAAAGMEMRPRPGREWTTLIGTRPNDDSRP